MHLEAQSPSHTTHSAPNFSPNTQATGHNYSRSQSQFEKKKVYESHRALSDLTRNYFPTCYLQRGTSPPAEQAARDACLQSCQNIFSKNLDGKDHRRFAPSLLLLPRSQHFTPCSWAAPVLQQLRSFFLESPPPMTQKSKVWCKCR